MERDMYSDEPEPVDGPVEESSEPSEASETPTAVIPKDFFQGEIAPGKVCSVRVERVYDDQVEVSYMSHSEEENAEGEGREQAPTSGMMME